jgi:transposase InsO family protein
MGLGEKKELVARYICQGLKRDQALSAAGISKHQYYHKPCKGKRGRKPSAQTLKIMPNKLDIERVDDSLVVDAIRQIHQDPDTDYGYRKMTFALMALGFIVNHKKVYRLMKGALLLKGKHQKAAREFVKYRKVLPTQPLEVLEMDIKFVWIERDRRHAFVLTVIDTFTRVLLGRKTAFSINQQTIRQLWCEIIEHHLQPYDCLNRKIAIEIRNDNDSRFIAASVQEFFKQNHISQVFTHPYTPQENGHIESFHAILSKKLKRHVFWSLQDLEQCLILFYEKYNNHRLHGATLYLPPMVFWQCWNEGLVLAEVNPKLRKIKFRPLLGYQQLSGKLNQREVSCPQPEPLEGVGVEHKKEMNGAVSLLQPSV